MRVADERAAVGEAAIALPFVEEEAARPAPPRARRRRRSTSCSSSNRRWPNTVTGRAVWSRNCSFHATIPTSSHIASLRSISTMSRSPDRTASIVARSRNRARSRLTRSGRSTPRSRAARGTSRRARSPRRRAGSTGPTGSRRRTFRDLDHALGAALSTKTRPPVKRSPRGARGRIRYDSARAAPTPRDPRRRRERDRGKRGQDVDAPLARTGREEEQHAERPA